MTTQRTGRRLVGERIRSGQVSLDRFFGSLADHPPHRVPGTAVFLFSMPDATPPAMIANIRHNNVLHERVIIVSVRTVDRPRVLPVERAEVSSVADGVHAVVLRYGFMEEPDIPRGLGQGAASRLAVDIDHATFFLGAESLVVTERPGMALWREHLYAAMSRNSVNAANFFDLPPERTITIGQQVEL
jgi:KUP system potassium uptake protein